MKKIILLPAGFLLTFLIVLFILTFLNLLLLFVSTYNNQDHISLGVIINYVPRGVLQVLPGSVIVSLIITLFTLLIKPVSTPVALILLMILAYGLIAGNPIWLVSLVKQSDLPEPEINLYLSEGKINLLDKTALYIPGRVSKTLKNIVLLDPSKEETRLNFYQKAWLEDQNRKLRLDLDDRNLMIPAGNSYRLFLFRFDQFTSTLLESFKTITTSINRMAERPDLIYFLFLFMLMLLLWTSTVFLRITKWSFFNILLYLSLIIGFLLLYSTYEQSLFEEIKKIIPNNTILPWLPLIFMGVINALLILTDLIFIKNKFWIKEPESWSKPA